MSQMERLFSSHYTFIYVTESKNVKSITTQLNLKRSYGQPSTHTEVINTAVCYLEYEKSEVSDASVHFISLF
jgi:hypothetical protein